MWFKPGLIFLWFDPQAPKLEGLSQPNYGPLYIIQLWLGVRLSPAMDAQRYNWQTLKHAVRAAE